MEDMDHPFDRSHSFAAMLPKFGESPNLMLENVHDTVGGTAFLELLSKRMANQSQPCLFFIALKGSVEQQLKPSTRRIVHWQMMDA